MHSLPNNFLADSGRLGATIDIIEFGDFTCNQCRTLRELLQSILNTFDGRINYIYYHFPNQQRESSLLAAKAAEAAGRQGYFWPMHQALFQQPMFSRATLSLLVTQLGMDNTRFLNDLDDEQLQGCIEMDRQMGYRWGVNTTPTLFIGGQQFHGKLTQTRLVPLIRTHLSRQVQPILSKVDLINRTIYWGNGE